MSRKKKDSLENVECPSTSKKTNRITKATECFFTVAVGSGYLLNIYILFDSYSPISFNNKKKINQIKYEISLQF